MSTATPPSLVEHDRLLLTVEETATMLGLRRSTAYEAMRRGELPSIRIGRRLFVPVAALDEWLRHASRVSTSLLHDEVP
jgi:excisionase family DNA binding protein